VDDQVGDATFGQEVGRVIRGLVAKPGHVYFKPSVKAWSQHMN